MKVQGLLRLEGIEVEGGKVEELRRWTNRLYNEEGEKERIGGDREQIGRGGKEGGKDCRIKDKWKGGEGTEKYGKERTHETNLVVRKEEEKRVKRGRT